MDNLPYRVVNYTPLHALTYDLLNEMNRINSDIHGVKNVLLDKELKIEVIKFEEALSEINSMISLAQEFVKNKTSTIGQIAQSAGIEICDQAIVEEGDFISIKISSPMSYRLFELIKGCDFALKLTYQSFDSGLISGNKKTRIVQDVFRQIRSLRKKTSRIAHEFFVR